MRVGNFKVGCRNIFTKRLREEDKFIQNWNDEQEFKLVIKHQFGFIKKEYFLSSADCAISQIRFKSNKQGSANATIKFRYFDIFIQPLDIVQLYLFDKVIYSGNVENLEDLEISVIPNRDRLDNLIINKSFESGVSATEMLSQILDSRFDDSKISFNRFKVDDLFYSKMTLFDLELPTNFEYKSMSDCITDIVINIDKDAVWGVDESNDLIIGYPNLNVVKTYYSGQQNIMYEDIKVNENWDGIEMTTCFVSRAGRVYSDEEKETDSHLVDEPETVNCGVVSDANLELKVGKRETLLHLSTMLLADSPSERNETALKYAKAMLESQQREKKIELRGCDFDIRVKPNYRIKIEDLNNDKRFKTISECEDLKGWTGASLVNDSSVQGESHLKARGVCEFELDFETCFDGLEFISFFGKLQGRDVFKVSFLDGNRNLVLEKEYINSDYDWKQYNIAMSQAFKYIRFEFVGDFELDYITAYCYSKQVYESNVVEVSTVIKNGIAKSDIICGSFDKGINDSLHKLEWEFKQIEAIQNI